MNTNTPISTVVRVDRSGHITRQDWFRDAIDSSLEKLGPVEYDFAELVRWDYINRDPVNLSVLNAHLRDTGYLTRCLSLFDGDILLEHPELYRTLFDGKVIPLWKSVSQESEKNALDGEESDGKIFVPLITRENGRVVRKWANIEHPLDAQGNMLILLFPH